MKNILLPFILLLVLIACKNDSPKTEPEINAIVGKWKLTAYERNVNGSNVWVPVDGEANYIIFRYDGVILDPNGCPNCAPKSYFVNGVLFEVTPKEAVTYNSLCPIIDCVGCETWNIDQTDNELIVTLCEPTKSRSKYIREVL